MCKKSLAKSNKLVYSRYMSKTIKLGEVVEIQTGYSFRGAVVDDGAGVTVIQAKDIIASYVSDDSLPRVRQQFPSTRLISDGDVLLTSRGSFRSAVAKFYNPAIASSSLFMIRLKTTAYTPEFLSLYLNSARAQAYLMQSAKGATIQSVSVSDLVNLSIPVVSLEKQKLLVELQQNIENQGTLLRSKIDIVNRIYTSTINKTLEGVA